MTNVDLSYAREVLSFRFEGDNDHQEREVRLSFFRRPIAEDQNKGQGAKLPNISICMHWGIWIEFEDTKKGLGRCIYSFDADVQTNKKDDIIKTTDWSELMKALFLGTFTVTGFEFFPDQWNQRNSKYATRHPYQAEIVRDDGDTIAGRLSPARLLDIVRQIARQYENKTYNLVFQNCQDFSIDLRRKIAQSMTKITEGSNQVDKTPWTAGQATTTAVVGAGVAAAAIWGLSKIFGSGNSQQEEKSEEESEDDEKYQYA